MHRPSIACFLLFFCAACSASPDDGSDSSQAGYTTVGACPDVGHDVSVSTCHADHQCGTATLPFCTIGQGVRATTVGEVDVAAGSYGEGVELRDGVTVLGGFEPTFTAPRDPAANATTIATAVGGALAWPGLATATVDGVGVKLVKAADGVTMPSSRRTIAIDGSAHATLRGVHVAIDPDARSASEERALSVGTGSGGAIVLHDVALVTPADAYESYGIVVEAGVQTSITADATTIAPGAARSESVGVDRRGDGAIALHGGSVRAGAASSAYGLRAVGSAAVDLDGVAIEAARATAAAGVQVLGASSLRIHGGSVNGKGPDGFYEGTPSPLGGVIADSVTEVVIDGGATIQGDDGAWKYKGQSAEPDAVYGVHLTNSKSVTSAHASIANATIIGGTYGELREAVAADGVVVAVTASDLVGSTQAIEYGYFGPKRTVGLEVTGAFAPGARLDVTKNVRIVGGDVQEPCFDYRCGAYGVYVAAEIDAAVEDNTLVRGAYAQSGFAAQALHVENGATTSIRRNGALVGGNVMGSDSVPTAGVEIHGTNGKRATVALEDNVLVAGSPDPAGHASSPVGFHGSNVVASIRRNLRIVGGYGWVVHGVWIERGAQPNEATIEDNVIDGGTQYGTGLEITGALADVERNVIHACELPDAAGATEPKCVSATNLDVGKKGLFVDWDAGSLLANNYVFSRETACVLGGTPDVTGMPQPPLSVTFVYNTCVAFGPAWRDDYPVVALRLGGAFTGTPLVADNVLDGVDMAFSHDSSFQNAAPKETYALENNDLVPHGQACLASVYLPGKICYPTLAELEAKSNAAQRFAGNVASDPKYPGGPRNPTSFRTCALAGLGTSIASVSADYEGAARGPLPAIGPAECK